MKKLILTLSFCVVGLFSMNAQIPDDCPSNSAWVSANCGSGCYQIKTIGTGQLSDYLWSKPNGEQIDAIAADLNRRCAGRSGAPTDSIAP
jgi:hypothetical protein